MNIIIDTNLWISFLIGKKLSAMRTLFTNAKIKIFVCDELLNEFESVLSRMKIQKYIADKDLQDTYKWINNYCHYVLINKNAFSSLRDKKDLFILSLAETISADYILTGDKDLLSLQYHCQTKIVTYKEFSAIIEK